jgi:hypothetical protein
VQRNRSGLVYDDAVNFNATPSLKGLDRCLRVDPKVAVNASRRGHPLTHGAISQKSLQRANNLTRRSLLKDCMGPPSGNAFQVTASTVPLTAKPAPC